MSYVRPPIDLPVFRDATGEPIAYGTRWGGGSPPEDSYSVTAHPDRFAPLHAVADALIAHLAAEYDVEVAEDPALASDLSHARPDVVRAVRVTPRDPSCAGLTFVFTSYPAVVVHAGLLHDFPFPVCGCDACDSTAEHEAEALEELVHGVASGGYRETVRPGRGMDVGFALRSPGGARSGAGLRQELSEDGLGAAARILEALPDGWTPWPRR